MQIETQDHKILYSIKDVNENIFFSYKKRFFDLSDLDMTNANLPNIVAEGLICMDSKFINANLANTDLYMMMACNTDFTHANLSNSILCGSNLEGAIFKGANLERADLGRDNLGDTTRMQNANFEGAIFKDAEYNSNTIFPAQFNPQSHGMIFVE
ncbi:pentapeptide repeat-containing protein [Candidatus Albibeggiatoa sp. nov. BB20]|uniref:pentapeptide repeat-containing protein n=1 Tax=Candidatus Albibeggiatoa sp. nov. BB20 TaxID=3162723 RepID=UPI0033653475